MKHFKFFTLILLTIAVVSCSKEAVDDVNKNNTTTSTTGDNNSGSEGGGSNTGGGDTNTLTTLLLTGDITNEEAVQEIAKVGEKIEAVIVKNTTQLTKVDVSKISTLITLTITQNEKLSEVNLSTLTKVNGVITVEDNPVLVKINLPSLKEAGTFLFRNNDMMKNISYPNLEKLLDGVININNNEKLEAVYLENMVINSLNSNSTISITYNDNLKTAKIPLAQKIELLWVYDNKLLSVLDLSSLKEAGLVFDIYRNSIINLSFPSLEAIGEGLAISGNNLKRADFPKLKTIKGGIRASSKSIEVLNFPLLESIKNPLIIDECSSLVEIAFPNLSTGLGFTIKNNESLKEINFPRLTTFTTSNSIYGDKMAIEENPSLEAINFESLKNAYSQIIISGSLNQNVSINFPVLETAETLFIEEVNLKALICPNLKRVLFTKENSPKMGITINETKGLDNFDFPSLVELDNLDVYSNPDLKAVNCPLLFQVQSTNDDHVNPSLYIGYNSKLTTLNFKSLSRINVPLSISSNDALEVVNFESLSNSYSSVFFKSNKMLNKIDFPLLKSATDELEIYENDNLKTINFPVLNEVKSITFNKNLTVNRLSLESLTKINEDVSLYGNSLLNEINLPSLQSVLEIEISSHDNLKEVNLQNLYSAELVKVGYGVGGQINVFNLSSITNFKDIDIQSFLSQSAIDGILERLVAITPAITDKDIELKGSPSQIGEGYVTTLKNQGNDVKIRD